MQPQDEQTQDWQQPKEAPAQAPFEVAPEEPIAVDTTPITSSDMQGSMPMPSATSSDVTTSSDDDEALIRWQATEYIHQERTAMWFVVLGLVVVALMVVAVVLIKSITFAILLPVMAAALVVYVKRPPSANDYIISHKGIHVNDHLYTYDQFRSFGVTQHAGHHSVVLVPRKRFQIGQTLYFPEEVGEPLVDMLAARLPMKEVEPDLIDKILAKLHL
jgi:hypothetical protein